ncbi:MAG: glutamyl-tRNA reductase [Saprospiraceae bacterium]|nr:glutamyl-tRNA reductase [Saprospiraceae bacterium]
MNTLSSYKILTITHKSTQLKNIGNFVLSGIDNDFALQQKLESIKQSLGLDELLYLSTCNRVLFLFTSSDEIDNLFLKRFESEVYPNLASKISLKESSVRYSGDEAIKHLLEVASSTDSMVIGEREILRQLREAYDRCYKVGATGDSIRLAIRLAIEAAKEVYSTTRIGQKPVSVVSLAIRNLLAKKPSKDARIILIGAGQTNTLVGKFLLKYGFHNFVVFNRSLENAKELASMLDCSAYKLDQISKYKGGFDILVTCTAATEPIITNSIYIDLLQNNDDKKILIDLSVPNNIDHSIQNNFFTTYIEIEGLKELVSENIAFRETEINDVQAIINKRLKLFNKIFKARQVELAMKEVPTQIKAIREHAVSSVFKNEVSSLDDDVQELINRMMSYMEKRCIAIPIKAAKEHLAGVVSTKK